MTKGWFRRIRSRRRLREAAQAAYLQVVRQAREPAFFAELGVPDSLDGRFELIVLHLALLSRRLEDEGEAGTEFRRALLETMIADMDRSLREIGVSDLSVGKRVKQMVAGFLGRLEAYGQGLKEGESRLSDALRRNVYGTVDDPDEIGLQRLVAYAADCAARLLAQPCERLLAGEVEFGPAPTRHQASARH